MVPDSFYHLDIPGRFNMLLLVDSRSTEQQKNAAYRRMKNMPYQDFLKTAYWKTIRDYVVHRHNGNCQSCLSSRAIDVHHRTYRNHGREHINLGDLMPVCRQCHEILHERFDGNRDASLSRLESIFEHMSRLIEGEA